MFEVRANIDLNSEVQKKKPEDQGNLETMFEVRKDIDLNAEVQKKKWKIEESSWIMDIDLNLERRRKNGRSRNS